MSIFFSCLAAVVVGAVLLLVGGFEYRCAALVQLPNDSTPESAEAYRRQLSDEAWRFFDVPPPTLRSESKDGAPRTPSWEVNVPQADLLRLSLITSDRAAGVAWLRTIAEAFVASVDRAAQLPGERERWLQMWLTELQERLDDAERKVFDSVAKTPEFDSRQQRQDQLTQWRQQRERFEEARSRLRDKATVLQKLRRLPEPTRAPVAAEVRQAALKADVPLQQDLAQLEAELADLKSALLAVWQQAAPIADDLMAAAHELRRVIDAAVTRSDRTAVQALIERLSTQAQSYTTRLESFKETWSSQFTLLERLQPDPLSTEVFDALDKIEAVQGDFFFHAAKPLQALGGGMRAVGEGIHDDARHLIIESDLRRAFEVLRRLHDRLDLTVSTRRPVRVEASLRTSRRLGNRCTQVMRRIDQRLAVEALAQARRDRQAALEQAEREMEDARARHDGFAHGLVELQERLNVTSDLTEEFLRASLRAEFASLELQDVARSMDKTEREIEALGRARAAGADQNRVRLRSVIVGDSPANLPQRLRLAALGALLTFAVSLLSQWRLLRK